MASGLLLALLLCLAALAPCADAAPPAQTPVFAPTQTPESPLKPQADSVANEITAVSQALTIFPATDTSELKTTLARRLSLLQRIGLSINQQSAALSTQESLLKTRSQVEAEIKQDSYQASNGTRPTFLDMDKLLDQLHIEKFRDKSVQSRVDSRKTSYDDAVKAFNDAEQARRKAKDDLAANTDAAKSNLFSEMLLTAEAESRAASQTARLREIELANEKTEQEIYKLRLAGLTKRADWWKERLLFTSQDLLMATANIDQQEKELSMRRQTAESERDAAQLRLTRASERMLSVAEPDPAQKEETEARKREFNLRQREVAILADRLQRLAEIRKVWERRYKVFNGDATPDEVKAWEDETKALRTQCDLEFPSQQSIVSDVRRDLRAVEEKTQATREAPAQLMRWLSEQQRHLQSLLKLEEEYSNSIEESWRLYNRFVNEINEEKTSWNLGEWLSAVWQFFSSIWNKELTETKDNPLTVKKIVIALFLFIVGFHFSGRVTEQLDARLLKYLSLPVGTASILKSLAYYLLLALTTLMALKVADVPLTLFAFLGGALAIGFGFGTQNIINNFISGLILLIERPITEGDQIEIAGIMGSVIRIGPRCTHIRGANLIDIYVPNSSLLQNNIINRSRTDDKIGLTITVPVEHQANTREAAKVLRRIVDEHGKILKKPEPQVLLKDFTATGYIFQVNFSIQASPNVDRNVIESDVRFMIDSHFNDADIPLHPQSKDSSPAINPSSDEAGKQETK